MRRGICPPPPSPPHAFVGLGRCEYGCMTLTTVAVSGPFTAGHTVLDRRSHWPRGLRRASTAARLLGLRVLIPPEAQIFVSCECCVLSGRCLCDGPITCQEDTCRLWCVCVCVCVCVVKEPRKRRPRSTRAVEPWGGGGGEASADRF